MRFGRGDLASGISRADVAVPDDEAAVRQRERAQAQALEPLNERDGVRRDAGMKGDLAQDDTLAKLREAPRKNAAG